MRIVRLAIVTALAAALIAPVSPAVAAPTECTIVGTEGDDILRGTDAKDVICGLGGNDTIYAEGGNDVIEGGDGADTIWGGDGNDYVEGEAGSDIIIGGPGADLLFGSDGSDALRGEAGNDTLAGGDGSDLLDGGNGVDYCATDGQDGPSTSCYRDGAKPKAISVAFQTATINSDQPAVQRMRLRLSDKGTGIRLVSVRVNSMKGNSLFEIEGSGLCGDGDAAAGTGCLLSGTPLDGVWEFAIQIPQYTPSSKWEVAYIDMYDWASNYRSSQAPGSKPVTFSTKSTNPDKVGPEVLDVARADDKSDYDGSTGEGINFLVHATDNLSGVKSMNLLVRHAACLTAKQMQVAPCKNAIGPNYFSYVDITPAEGDMYAGTLWGSEHMFNGNWVIAAVYAVDNVGNRRELTGKSLAPWGAAAFTIFNGKSVVVDDSKSPTISDIEITPTEVDSSTMAAAATVKISASDNKGVDLVWASVVGPNSIATEPERGCKLTSGTAKKGVWTCTVQIPAHGATGKWMVEFLVRDAANNNGVMSQAVFDTYTNDGYFIQNG